MNRNSMLDPRPKPEMIRIMDGSTSHVDNISSPGESIFILDADAPTHEILEPEKVDTPLVFASPHSGRGYPSDFLESCTAPLIDLRRVEDAFVDLLFKDVVSQGSPLIHSKVGRACIDLNRAPTELDSTMFDSPLDSLVVSRSPRVSAGLGCIPRIAFAGRAIYDGKLDASVAQSRLEQYYHPYHRALDDLLARSHSTYGASILIDCHSMPSATENGAPLPDIILGDRFGASCSPALTRVVEQSLKRRGYTVTRNSPYAGGHTTVSRGRPAQHRHALQIEINRKLYLDEMNITLKPEFKMLSSNLEACFAEVRRWSKDFVSTRR